MKVLIDARKLGHGGIGAFIDTLIGALVEEVQSGRATLRLLVAGDPARIAAASWGHAVESVAAAHRPYSPSELLGFGRSLSALDLDLVHFPHYTVPLWVSHPVVTTIHDLIHLEAPERFYYPWIAGRWVRHALTSSTAVATVSCATRDALLSRFPEQRERFQSRLAVIPNALGAPYFEYSAVEGGGRKELPRQFFLAVLSMDKPHKGREKLLRAYHQLSQKLGNAAPELVLVGPGAEGVPAAPSIHPLGRVPDFLLCDLYRRARFLVVPSSHEGFGLPLLEAHSQGTPAITLPVPALRELHGEFDLCAPDFSAEALAAALEDGTHRPALDAGQRFTLADQTRTKYAPLKMARSYIELYARAVGLQSERAEQPIGAALAGGA